MVANQLIKVFGSMTSQLEYESRFLEVIAVACAGKYITLIHFLIKSKLNTKINKNDAV